MKTPFKGLMRQAAALMALSVFLFSFTGTASAAILFQDDTFADVESDAIKIGSNDAGAVNTAIQFGADSTGSENGNITWNIGTNTFGVDHSVAITGGLSATGDVNFSASTQTRVRESSSPETLAACSTIGEIIVDTGDQVLEVCTGTGIAGVATWGYPTAGAINSGASNPGTCVVGDLFFNTTSSTLEVCSAANTWETAGPTDFEQVYAKDADKTLTTGGTNFTIAAGAGTVNLNEAVLNTTSTGATTLDAGSATADAIKLNASNAAGGITALWGTGGMNFSGPGGILNFNATGAFNVSGTGGSTVQTTSGDLALKTNTSGSVVLTATGAGKSITFADVNVSTPIKFSNIATALDATFTAGDGILDAINSFTSTTAGKGASNVGVASGLTNITGSDVQAALASIDGQLGASSANNEDLTFHPQYPDAVIFRDGSSNNGTLVQDYDTTGADYGSVTDPRQQYYGWTSNKATLQDIDVKTRFPLPPDFVTIGNLTLRYLTGTATAANNKVDVSISNATDLTAAAPTLCGTAPANTSVTWGTATISSGTITTGCTGGTALGVGDIVEVDTKLYDITGGTTFARAGTLNLAYSN